MDFYFVSILSTFIFESKLRSKVASAIEYIERKEELKEVRKKLRKIRDR